MQFPDAESLGIRCPRVREFVQLVLATAEGPQVGTTGTPAAMVLEHRWMVEAAMKDLGKVEAADPDRAFAGGRSCRPQQRDLPAKGAWWLRRRGDPGRQLSHGDASTSSARWSSIRRARSSTGS